jgi:putative ATP-binding cassette transporter
VLGKLEIKQVIERIGGLDTEADWDNLLSLSEQQALCIARIVLTVPRMVIIERLDSTLGPESLPNVLELLRSAGVTYVVFDGRHADLGCFNAMLTIAEDGTASWQVLDPSGEAESP